jgi:hypothetical protein
MRGFFVQITSKLVKPSADGVVLSSRADDVDFTAIVIVGSDPGTMPDHDLNDDAQVHITLVETPPETEKNVEDLLKIVKQGDCAIFLCADDAAYGVTLRLLGYVEPPRS